MRIVRVHDSGGTVAHTGLTSAFCLLPVRKSLWSSPATGPRAVPKQCWPKSRSTCELPVVRPNDVNRHDYADPQALRAVLLDARPDVVDVDEEPFSSVRRQVLSLTPAGPPAVGYSAQNANEHQRYGTCQPLWGS